MATAEALPSVSNPSEPETRTYLPPADAEVAQAIHEASAEEDDDEDEASDDSHTQHTTAAATPAPQPRQPAEQPTVHHQEIERPLNEQFEEIMRAEMGEDYNRMASGEHLGETEDELQPDDPRAFVANWPHQQSEYAEPEPPANDGEPDAFYYAESAPQGEPAPFSGEQAAAIARAARFDQFHAEARDANTPYAPNTPHRAGGGGGGTTPPTGGTNGAASGGMPFGGGGSPSGANFNVAPVAQAATALTSPLEMFRAPGKREKAHKGRYFAAGFITGWAVKQHLANKKLERVNQEHQKATEAQQEKVDTLNRNQYHMGQRLNRTEAQLRETETAATQQAARTAEAQSIARQHQERAERAVAEAPLAAAAAVEAGRVAERVAEATAPEHTAEAPAPVYTAEQPVRQVAERPQVPNRMESTPLQYAAATAETPFAAASAATATGAAERAPAPFAAEAQKVAPAAERPPKTAQEQAAELVEEAYKLQAGEHVERATGGGHDIIVDKHGHEVQGAKVYGEEFKFQQRQEQMRAGVFSDDDDNNKQRPAEQQQAYDAGIVTGISGGGGHTSGYPGIGYSSAPVPPAAKRLPLGIPQSVNPQHLLRAKNQNPMVATIASPWLWASVIVLIVAFFIAAFV
jgi:hypothetical protein